MAVFTNKEPDQCFNATSCLIYEFVSDSAVDVEGSRDEIVISSLLFLNMQVGSSINLNGSVFTIVASGASLADNEINYDSNLGTFIDNIDQGMAQNFLVLKDYDINTSTGNLVLTPRNAITDTYFLISNTTNTSGDILIESSGNPVRLKEMYCIKMCLFFLNPLFGNQESVEIDFFPLVSISNDGTTASDAVLTRNVGCFLEPYFDCPVPPTMQQGNDLELFQTSGLTIDVKPRFAEKHNGSTFLTNYLQQFRVFHADVCDEEIDCHYPLGIESGQEICITCTQPYWIHRYIPQGSTGDVNYFITARDAFGNVISTGQVASESIEESLLYMPAGVNQFKDELIAIHGLQEEQVKDIDNIIATIVIDYGGSIRLHHVGINIINASESINLIYKNRFNVYQGIALNVSSSRSYNTVLNYIEICGLCKKNRKVISKDQYELCSVSLIEELCLSDKDIADFFKSESVFLVDSDGNTFPVQIEGQSVVFEERGVRASQSFNIKIYPC